MIGQRAGERWCTQSDSSSTRASRAGTLTSSHCATTRSGPHIRESALVPVPRFRQRPLLVAPRRASYPGFRFRFIRTGPFVPADVITALEPLPRLTPSSVGSSSGHADAGVQSTD